MFFFLPIDLQLILALCFFLLGAFFGSALHCLAYRMVRGQSWATGRSCCPICGHTLQAVDLIPVLSWIFLRGRCRHCGGKIPARYILAEAGLGLVFVGMLLRFGLTRDTVNALILCCCLFCLSLVDWESRIIPHRFLVIPAVCRILQLLVEGGLLRSLLPALLFGGGLLALSLLMDHLLHKDTLGGGDIKLMAMLGLYFSIPECLLLLMFACVSGILAVLLRNGQQDGSIPFGPFLSMAACFTLLFGNRIVSWYWGLFYYSGG